MTATDPADITTALAGTPGPAEQGADAIAAAATPAAATPVDQTSVDVSPADASLADAVEDEQQVERAIQRIVNMPRDVGWMMVSVGVIGVILPGLPGTPFLLAGVAVLAPGGPRLLARWTGRKPTGIVQSSLKLIGRWLDDLDRRYP
jgi:hypothetical protein